MSARARAGFRDSATLTRESQALRQPLFLGSAAETSVMCGDGYAF
jgi:hypothetical protein